MSTTTASRRREEFEEAHGALVTAEARESLAYEALETAVGLGLAEREPIAAAVIERTRETNAARVRFVDAGRALLGGRSTELLSRPAAVYLEAAEELATGAYTLTEVRAHARSRLAR